MKKKRKKEDEIRRKRLNNDITKKIPKNAGKILNSESAQNEIIKTHKKKIRKRLEDERIKETEYHLNHKKAIMSHQKLNQCLIEILLHMNLMWTEIKHYNLVNTQK